MKIPYGKHDIDIDDINAVVEVLQSNTLTQGPYIQQFEESFAKYVGSSYAVAVSNGTAALHLSMIALNANEGDNVITTPITFVASANCVKYVGGHVVFSDIDRESYLLDLDKIEDLLSKQPVGTYKGIIPVQFSGRMVNLEKLRAIADKYKMWIVEDGCHSPGATFVDSFGKDQKSGNGNFADLSVFSFHPVKHIACGEGGMITTNNKFLYERLLKLRTHGITKNIELFKNSISESGGQDYFPNWYMEMQELGYNYRMTDIQAALGNSQLKKADSGLIKRRQIAYKYNEAFKNNSLILNHSGYHEGHAYHLYIIEVENRLELYNFLLTQDIIAQIHYFPCHLMPYHMQFGTKKGDFINAESYYRVCLSIPIYPSLKDEEQLFVIEKINTFLNES